MTNSDKPFTRDELILISNALNEICNGIDLAEFETRLGFTREQAERLMEKVSARLGDTNGG